jgi:hypothetical protein
MRRQTRLREPVLRESALPRSQRDGHPGERVPRTEDLAEEDAVADSFVLTNATG